MSFPKYSAAGMITAADWDAFVLAMVAHAVRHELAGVDEIDVVGLSGLLADDQHVLDAEVLAVAAALVHAARHEDTGADEISVTGLSGLLADDQHVLDAEVLLVASALVHAGRHKDGGADELDVSELAGAIGAAGEVPETDGAAVTWVDPDGRYIPLAHAASHKDGGADELDVSELAGAIGAAGEVPETDGAAVTWVDPDGRYAPLAHVASHLDGATDEIDAADLAGTGGAVGEIIESDGAALSYVEPDGRYAPLGHEASHRDGGADEIEIDDLPGAAGAAGEIVESDGAAMSFVDPDGRYDPKAHVLATTGPHNAPLPLTDLAVGARGEIIHRGVVDWAALPVGALNDVLNSGGPGADVFWAAGGVAVHGAAEHTDITRYRFLPANEAYVDDGTPGPLGFWSTVLGGANLGEPTLYFTMKVPDDFVSFTSMRLLWNCAAAAGNMFWRFGAYYASPGQIHTTHLDNPGMGLTATGGVNILNLQVPGNPLTLAGLVAADYIGIYLTRDGTDLSDTLDTDVHFFGVLFTYTASQ